MDEYDISVGEDQTSSMCHCCGKKSSVGHGFVHKNGDAYAIYGAGWCTLHSQPMVSFAVAIGDWHDDGARKEGTVCFGIEAFDDGDNVSFRVIDPEQSPWPSSDLMGTMISRRESLIHPLIREAFSIVENILHNHSAIHNYLSFP